MKDQSKWYLEARYTHVQSHYKKAVVIEENELLKLESYNTLVAVYDKSKKELKVLNTQSLTTLRHLTDFIKQYTDVYIRNNDDIRKLQVY